MLVHLSRRQISWALAAFLVLLAQRSQLLADLALPQQQVRSSDDVPFVEEEAGQEQQNY